MTPIAGQIVGTLAELWRYPVQSLRGEMLAAATVGPSGLTGDRGYAIVDEEEAKVVSSSLGRE